MNYGNILSKLDFSKQNPMKTTILKREKFEIVRIALGKGLMIPPHKGGHAVFFMILQGRGIFTCGDEKVELVQNQYLHIETNDIRGIEALEDLVVLAIKE
jgi:quercetin dioxygenase-like cupin family protein